MTSGSYSSNSNWTCVCLVKINEKWDNGRYFMTKNEEDNYIDT